MLDAEERYHGDKKFSANEGSGQFAAAPILYGVGQHPNKSEPHRDENEENDRRDHIFNTLAALMDAGGDNGVQAVGETEKAEQYELDERNDADFVLE